MVRVHDEVLALSQVLLSDSRWKRELIVHSWCKAVAMVPAAPSSNISNLGTKDEGLLFVGMHTTRNQGELS